MASAFEAAKARQAAPPTAPVQSDDDRFAELEKRYEVLSRKFEEAQEERYGIKPDVAPLRDEEPEDDEPTYTRAEVEKLFADKFAALEAQLKEAQKANTGKGVSNDDPGGGGGEPVPHHIHLEDGRVIQGHEGLGTHYSDEDGIYRIVAAYPVKSAERE